MTDRSGSDHADAPSATAGRHAAGWSDSLLAVCDAGLAPGTPELDLSDAGDVRAVLMSMAVGRDEALRRKDFLLGKRDRIDALFAFFHDETSRLRLFDFLCARVLGPTRYRMAALDRWTRFALEIRDIPVMPSDGVAYATTLLCHKVRFDGEDLLVHCPYGNVISPFLERQYFLQREGACVAPEAGDVVFDLGGGLGDTALAFAVRVGPTGRVLCCEPTTSELAVHARNMRDNPRLAERITLVAQPVSDRPGRTLRMHAAGAGSRISGTGGTELTVSSIDALVRQHDLSRVDFIKMDIEGEELNALRGGASTIDTFRPRLAICAYHGWQIFELIDHLRSELVDYRYHVETHAPVPAETVIYAEPVEFKRERQLTAAGVVHRE